MKNPLNRELSNARVGYVPYSHDLTGPGDRRRFPYYARARGIDFEIADPEKKYDVVILSGRADLSLWCHYTQGKLVYELIDSYLSIPKKSIKGQFRGLFKYLSRQSRYLQMSYWMAVEGMCARADAVVCSTQEQKKVIERFCLNVHEILDFHLDIAKTLKTEYKAGPVFRLVWEGLPQTLGSIKIIKPVLEILQKKYRIEVHIVTDRVYYNYLGYFWKTNALSKIKKIIPEAHFHEWSEASCADIICSCDLAFIPLDLEDPFSAGKPENKLLLFWRMGMPVVSSASPAYMRAMKAAGLDCTAKTESEWLAVLEHLIQNEDRRRQAGLIGLHYVREKCDESIYLKKWDDVFLSLGFSAE